ncbi:MAG TPA: hypothetical protein VL137_03560 [Polyangiaceae bacterium]|nr:hypothetical protein [Polyangiaceae bacterium]
MLRGIRRLLVAAFLPCAIACDPGSGYKTSYRAPTPADGGNSQDVGALVEWMKTTFGGIYRVHSYLVADGSCSASGTDESAQLMAQYFWVNAFEGLGATTEACLCGNTQEECRTFIAQERAGALVACLLQRTATDKVNDHAITHHWQQAGTPDGNNTCVQGGSEDVTFDRNADQIQVDHEQTLVDYPVTDGNCTDARGDAAAHGVACTHRDVLVGTWVASE